MLFSFYLPSHVNTTTTMTTIKPKIVNQNNFIITSTTTEAIPTVGTLITTTRKITTSKKSRIDCPSGFEVGGLGQCIDIDECRRNFKMCGEQQCVNVIGSFRYDRDAFINFLFFFLFVCK